jgi:hypothetical protein
LIARREQAAASFQPLRDQTIAVAEKVVHHQITGWGTVAIQHGRMVDFNADYGVAGKYGFHYWDWAKPLVSAFLLTNDQKYLSEFDALFNTWFEQRDKVRGQIPELDVIWYELGLGNRNRVFLEYYCLPCAQRSIATHERMLKTLLGAARWLDQEERRMYRDGNWQIFGSYAVAQIGLTIPEFKQSAQWSALGARRLAEHLERDFFPDGCHSERVPSSYMLTAYRDPRNLAYMLEDRPQDARLTKRLRDPLQRTLNWYLYALPPDGFIPAINDCARLKMPAALFDDGQTMFGRMDMSFAKQKLLNATDASDPVDEPERRSMCFRSSGFTFMRSDWTPGACYMLINHGPSGGGHSHKDALSFQMHAYGQAMAIDSGIGYTYDDPKHGSWYKRTMAHNVLMVDDQDLNRASAQGKEVISTSLAKLDFFAATHHGYEASRGIVHRRHVAFVRPDYFVVFDQVTSIADERRSLSWNLHATLQMAPFAGGFASAGSPGLLLLPARSDWKASQSKGVACVRGIAGFDRDYADIPWLRFDGSISAHSTTSMCVLLYPFNSRRPDVAIRQIGENHFTVEHPDGKDRLLFGSASSDGVAFQGVCAMLRMPNGQQAGWAVSQATHLVAAGKELLRCSSPQDAEGSI